MIPVEQIKPGLRVWSPQSKEGETWTITRVANGQVEIEARCRQGRFPIGRPVKLVSKYYSIEREP